uniref:Beta-1,4 N-acetylgalactosaminyltransferase 2-like n=1 Tax=Sinocyclocheilus grahami TaxID=75366 RepID=A0A672LJA5_SINGR
MSNPEAVTSLFLIFICCLLHVSVLGLFPMRIQHPVTAKTLCQQTSLCQKMSWMTCRNAGQRSSDNTRSGYSQLLRSLQCGTNAVISLSLNELLKKWHVSFRSGKENDVLLLAPANTPLQYPMRGFRVTPMNKTLIPGDSDFFCYGHIIVSHSLSVDVNTQVTVLIKAFLRYKELNVLINSIRLNYPKIKIIVADDSLNPEKVVGDNIEHYIMPPAQGWFAGRNLAVSQVTTKYFLWVDDDFVFLNETRIESFVNIMEAVPELDVVGGQVGGNQFAFQLQYQEGNSEEGGCITRVSRTHAPLPGFNGCFFADGVVNYFLGRTEAVRRVGFDPFLKRVAHTEFFVDGLGELLVVTCKGLTIGHQKHSPTNKYGSYRHPPKSDSEAKMTHHFFKNHLKCIKY